MVRASLDLVCVFLVLQEVETKIESFRGQLRTKLHELPSPLEEQTRLIRCVRDSLTRARMDTLSHAHTHSHARTHSHTRARTHSIS